MNLPENTKLALMGGLAVLIFGVTFVLGMSPREQRALIPYAIGGVAGLGLLGLLAVFVRVQRQRAKARQQAAIDEAVAGGATWLLLRPKEARSVDVDKVTLWKRLAYAQPTQEHFSFEVFGNGDKQGMALHASQTKGRSVLREFFQEWADMQRRPAAETDNPAFVPEGWHVHWIEIGPASADKPITISSRDPLLGALSEIADIAAPTRALVQVIARSDTTTRRQLGEMSAAMRSGQVQDAGVRYQRTKEAKTIEQRGSGLFLQAVIRISAISPFPDRVEGAAMALANTLCNQFGPDNPVVILAQSDPKKPVNLAARAISGGAIRSWADNEIVALAHLPGGDALKFAPLLSTGSAKALPAKPDLRIPKKAGLARFEI